MNASENQLLIDENEVRAALRPLRSDAVQFTEGVRRRILEGQKRATEKHGQREAERSSLLLEASDQSHWLRIAASFLPVQLLGGNFAPVPFAALSLGKKLVVAAAFPFLCFLMIGLTIVGMLQVRSAAQKQNPSRPRAELAQQAIRQWWRQYGWIAGLVFALTLVAPWLGWSTPLMIALVASGVAAVSMVRTLARQGLIERTTIGGACGALLGLLGQTSSSLAMINSTQVLDTYLTTGVLFGGAFVIGALVHWGHRPSQRSWAVVVTYLTFAVGVVVVCSQSLWNGGTARDIQQFVTSSQAIQLGSREIWEQSAQWLNETGVGFDKQLVLQRLSLELNARFKSLWLTSGIRSGLISDAELPKYVDVAGERSRLANPSATGRAFTSLESEYANLVVLSTSDDVDDASRQLLLERLSATWDYIASADYTGKNLRDVLLLTELFDRFDPSYEKGRRTADVHRWLVQYQVTERSAFRDVGGFCAYKQIMQSDRKATLNAIDLMLAYGMPSDIDSGKLRAYLRPAFLYDTLPSNFVPKKVASEQLQQLGGVPELTAISYVRSEMMLWLSILLVLLLVYATLTSPVQAYYSD